MIIDILRIILEVIGGLTLFIGIAIYIAIKTRPYRYRGYDN